MLAAAVALFLAAVAGTEVARRATAPAGPAASNNAMALDFIAFYTGGSMVAEGRGRDLFDLKAVKRFQDDIAARHGVALGDALGPWWNPPFYAWVFAPLSRLPFGTATAVWVGLNAACAAAACWLLARTLPAAAGADNAECERVTSGGWRTRALVPVFVGLSVPFIHALSHGQNACTSLLILTLTILAWRAERPVLAGMVAGLMAYKPQHAVVLGVVLALSVGWRAVLGLSVTGAALLLVTVVTLPGSLGDFLHQMPANVRFVQERCVYMWERHATAKAFWRMLLQGRAIGPASDLVNLLTAASAAGVGLLLLRLTPAARLLNPFDHADRSSPEHRDRLIAATVLATPLLMPFYFDYDLLLLAVPAVLLAGLKLRHGRMTDSSACDRMIRVVGPALYAWLLLNADVGERTRVNLAVPLLAVLATAVALPRRREEAAAQEALTDETAGEPQIVQRAPMSRAA
ncbi:MAG: hypothetical protein JWO31_4035 [Phycisphaerales bacterium]|nr:hypothetical protein [Phycisphaerales bacterium]